MCPDIASRRDMLKGTPTFASLAAHYSRRPMRPVDDIESLVYTLAYLAAGGLPWEDLTLTLTLNLALTLTLTVTLTLTATLTLIFTLTR